MTQINIHLAKLGLRVTDRVTGFKGVITSIGFDLFGCVQAVVNPGLGSDGKFIESAWFDIARLQVDDPTPVMQVPDFETGRQAEGLQGAAQKPTSTRF